MRRPALAAALLATLGAAAAPAAPPVEWTLHKTADSAHPDGREQAWLWLMNRARRDPAAEGAFLAALDDPSVLASYAFYTSQYGLDLEVVADELAALPAVPPAAFDRRLYAAARDHALAMIAADDQAIGGQLDRILPAGFVYPSVDRVRGNAYGFASGPLDGHAAWNVNWAAVPGGLAPGRPNRTALMSGLSNVGLAVVADASPATLLGPLVVAANYADANLAFPDHYDRFVVGTVWEDLDGDGRYDPGEGVAGVTVDVSPGAFYAVTAAGGGYAVPILAPATPASGTALVAFSGAGLPERRETVSLAPTSLLVDYVVPEPGSTSLALTSVLALSILAHRARS